MKLLTKSFQMLAAGVLLAVAFTACTKASERITDAEGELVEVRIYAGGVESGAMSKAGEVDAVLAAAYPAGGVSLRLVNALTGIAYTATTGEAVLLPVGAYSVTGRYKPSSKGAFNGSAYVASAPAFSIDASLEVVEGVSEYSIPVAWECFAVCVDTGEVASWKWWPYSGEGATPPVLTAEGVELFFLCGTLDAAPMRVSLAPCDLEHYAATDWWLATNRAKIEGRANGLMAQAGRWYRLHPDGVVTESGALALSWPSWECGAE